MTLKELAEHRIGAHGAVGVAVAKIKKHLEKGTESAYLRDALAVLSKYRRECIVCLTPIKAEDTYMVKKAMWREMVGEHDVCVCLPCFERFLGRDVEIEDLAKDKNGAHLPINYHLLDDQTVEDFGDSIIEDPSALAARKRTNEEHYAGILDRMLTSEQKRFLEENPEGHQAGRGFICNQMDSGKKKKKRGY
jgi:hypothetical protein